MQILFSRLFIDHNHSILTSAFFVRLGVAIADSCFGLNQTVYTYPYQKAAKVKLSNGVIAKLPVGVSEFQWYLVYILCTFYVKVLGEFCRVFSSSNLIL